MKSIICFTILFTITSITFSQSVLHYQTGTGIEVQPGADVCADQVVINGALSGGGTICDGTIYNLNLTVFIEGFYNSILDIMVSDTITVYLRNASVPYSIADSSKAVLSSSGLGSFYFLNADSRNVFHKIIYCHGDVFTFFQN